MIYGVGTDIVSVARMQKSLDKYGDQFARRILADSEFEAFAKNARPAHYLAKRFAAKEATVKALGTGFRDGISMKHIVVAHDDLGKPVLSCTAVASQMMDERGVVGSFISLSDEDAYAVAYVVLTI
jgi:holo-[acyl-carrier protein] synthase